MSYSYVAPRLLHSNSGVSPYLSYTSLGAGASSVPIRAICEQHNLKQTHKPQMYFRLPHIQLHIILFANCVADIENTGFGFES